ncbi:hypothetical protein AAZX31_14G199000 [Glycine max]|uniref:NAC domain-containing protein n=4 Tax=Glycine subgen. Soja TaxID=1462606 RepID=I1MBV5_SOYBN|nr:uncharacterized protein LOC100818640 isoform X1 [Glycine max]XP_028200531.1 uncharacterized protein LOC114384901 [Glycine soja]KAG5122792.1 hypothetical protein JHK84_041132 [Glycine max]KAH1095628.1 hypothetical protein GYH30_040766 [Glycine max]KAH1214612.1 hypothetical protein GmHk_14G042304 [Glycine max]KHN39464.1 hypothetical protein glysoja_016851 [Glycine soja]KRH17342.1 hypothetical protein GLYMA_14G214400v4 [Glycine max]|eukprot:XP_003544369.1 uncharacterized protein LOC100818640 [Glycine max]
MTCSCFSNSKSIDSSHHSLDHVPLSQRLKLLHPPILQNDTRIPLTLQFDAVVKKEHEGCDSQLVCPTFETDACGVEKTSANVILARCPTLSAFDGRATIKVEDYEIPSSSVDKGKEASIQLDFPIPKVKKEIPEGIVDDLDHIVLKERLRMLLARKLPGLSNASLEGGNAGLLETITEQTVKKVNEEINFADGKAAEARDQVYDNPEGSNISLSLGATCGSSLLTDYATSKSTGSVISSGLLEDDHLLKSRGIVEQFDSHEEHNVINNDGPISSTSPTFIKVKDEPWDIGENYNVTKDAMGSISFKLSNVKSEREVHNEYHDDQAEHMNLIDRLNFLMAGADSSLNISTSYSLKTQPSSSMSSPIFSKSAEPSSIKSRRKRKKTATDSVQEALEEDAPGLLQVLLDKGVLVDEIKLYGEKEDDEALDESFCEDSFSKLEALITKIFPQRYSFLKLPNTRASKASRASYWLACLISLVEQTRYLKFRKWPVEWGWCRDLQSFIFVFERHNRIVLERPEYGYATYFFELVESLPVEWQLKRLVIAMKLTTCSRISIIENKELVVGEDLSEGEAKVLMEYGWTPNTGLGTMLNYCGRVVHDRKSEDNSSEWRSKIGKLLMDGYNGGTIVMPTVPKKVAEYMCSQSPDSDISCSSPMSD